MLLHNIGNLFHAGHLVTTSNYRTKNQLQPELNLRLYPSFVLYFISMHSIISMHSHTCTQAPRAQMEVAEHWQMHQSRRGIGHRWHVLDKHLYPGEAQHVHVDSHACVFAHMCLLKSHCLADPCSTWGNSRCHQHTLMHSIT